MTRFTKIMPRLGSVLVAIGLGAGAAIAQAPHEAVAIRPTLNSFGLPGLVDMPTASAMPDADLAVTLSSFAGQTRGTLSFQITPRLTGSFRYSGLEGFSPGGGVPSPDFVYYDRSFDLHFLLLEEGGFWPALAVGLRDFGGTGVYGSEYVVASRHFGERDQIQASLGIGWGRLGSRNGVTNPLGAIDERFETRPNDFGLGGTFNGNQWFRGDAAVFGGVEWRPTERLAFQVEYSSDAYAAEQADGVFMERSPINLGMTYSLRPGATVGLRYMHGSELGFSFSYALNPTQPGIPGGRDGMPLPVMVRPVAEGGYDQAWLDDEEAANSYFSALERALEAEGMILVSLGMEGQRASVRLENERFEFETQALGRAARIMAAVLPHSIEQFELLFIVQGIPGSRVVIQRRDLEDLEHHPDGAFLSFGRTRIQDAREMPDASVAASAVMYPRLDWHLSPYLETSLFDPDDPYRYAAGLELGARLEFLPGLFLGGALRARAFGDIGESRRVSSSILPHVRSDANIYDREGEFALSNLSMEYFARPAEDVYTRLSIGYLEPMFAGVSGEVLWQPVDTRFGFGVELNHVWQRDFDQQFGLQDYSVTSGHISAYYSLAQGYDLQLDVGRYLAGDWGATISVDRTFSNGWSIGAFATLTDVSFEDFGEGSFDKGIRLNIPFGWFLGTSSRNEQLITVRPIQRDGGARLEVPNRLHGLVRDYHEPSLGESWGRVWR